MLQRGRKSSLNVVTLDVTSTRSRLTAPSLLTKAEAKFFVEVAAVNPHLRPADAPLLAAFAQAMVKTYRLARQSDISAWEKSARVAMALATKLRITAQSQVHPEAAGRKRPHTLPSYYETETMESDNE
jgi:hypothetical protein